MKIDLRVHSGTLPSVWFEPLKPSQFSNHQVSHKMRTIGLENLKFSQHFENQVENQLETQQIYDTHPTLIF